MARIPQLRSLHLRFVPLSGDLLHALAKLPLTSLELEFCRGLDAARDDGAGLHAQRFAPALIHALDALFGLPPGEAAA